MREKGFTLIELMVVIAIIAVLATIGATLFSQAQANARDGKRKADIDSIGTALENRANIVTNQYCTGNAISYCGPQASWFAGGSVPKDPISNGSYVYSGLPVDGAASYTICAYLESKGSGNSVDTNGGQGAGSKDYYCRKNQQQ